MTRLKGLYEEAAAGGYDYAMALTADAVAVPRRGMDLIELYLWRRGVFAVQYSGMSDAAIDRALQQRCADGAYGGGMPPGATIDAKDAVAQFLAGEKGYLRQLKEAEPLLARLTRAGRYTSEEMTAAQMHAVFERNGLATGLKVGTYGINNLRRATMVGIQKGAERLGFDGAMHAKKRTNHRQPGHAAREKFYEDTEATNDAMAFMCGRMPERIESLKSLSNQVVPELAKYRRYEDVPKKDEAQAILTQSELLASLRKAKQKHAAVLRKAPSNCTSANAFNVLCAEEERLTSRLKRQVLYEKQQQVHRDGVEQLAAMPLDEVARRHEVNSYEGVTLSKLMLRYGCEVEVPFEVSAIEGERVRGKGKAQTKEYRVHWRGFTESRRSWVAAEAIDDAALVSEWNERQRPSEAADRSSEIARAVVDESAKTTVETVCTPAEAAVAQQEPATPAAGRTVARAAPPSVRGQVHMEEEMLVQQFCQLLAVGGTKQAAVASLAASEQIPPETLRKKLARAERRLALRRCSEAEGALHTVTIGMQKSQLRMDCASELTMHELQAAMAARMQRNPLEVRLCGDGERIPATLTVAEVLQQQIELHAFEARCGGAGDAGQAEGIDVPGGCSPLSPDAGQAEGIDVPGGCSPLSPGGTEVLTEAGTTQESAIELSPEQLWESGMLHASAMGASQESAIELSPQLQSESGTSHTSAIDVSGENDASDKSDSEQESPAARTEAGTTQESGIDLSSDDDESPEVLEVTPVRKAPPASKRTRAELASGDEGNDDRNLTLAELRAKWARADASSGTQQPRQ